MDRHRDLLLDAAAVLLLCVLVVAFTWRIGLAGRVLAGGDIFTYFYPYWAEATRAIRSGRLPLWNPYLFMGAPFMANSQVGSFYPLNWPLWLLFPAQRSVHLTIVFHLCLAALNAYLWGRSSLKLGRVGAWSAGAAFALGGYLGAQVEHINQLQGLVWLPAIFCLYDQAASNGTREARRRMAFLALVGLVVLVLLAGHTQTAFISLVGLASYGVGPALWTALCRGRWSPVARRGVLLVLTAAASLMIAGVQLVPTAQLARASVRARGLPFNERLSFSLPPLYVGRALLPRFGDAVSPDHLEHVAYVGTTGLVLAIVGFAAGRDRRSARPRIASAPAPDDLRLLLLVLLGFFFALGVYNPLYLPLARYAPGFAHFRVPARWLALYSLGMAAFVGRAVQMVREARRPTKRVLLFGIALTLSLVLLAAVHAWLGEGGGLRPREAVAWVTTLAVTIGLLWTAPRVPRVTAVALLALLVGELYLTTLVLPHAQATAPQAFTSLRPALAHLLSAAPRDGGPPARFLSISDTTFDPGDLSLMETIYAPQLTDAQFYRLVVASKQKEIVSPNLPLTFGIPAVDGYGGGVLPLERYVRLLRLLLPPEQVSIDGRLRENLAAVPDDRWLSLFNVRYLITDKLRDAWIDDVFYDLQHGARLSRGEQERVPHIPRFEATALGLVSHVEGAGELPEGARAGVATVRFRGGATHTFPLRVDEHLERADPSQADAGSRVTRVRWTEPGKPVSITLRATLPEGAWVVHGLSLIDERTGSFQSLVMSDQGRFRLVHSGDVKIYENLGVLPRAFVVPEARLVADDQATLNALQDSSFDPRSTVVLHSDQDFCTVQEIERLAKADSIPGSAQSPLPSVTILQYRPERVTIEADLDEPGYLVLTDAWYPGWRVEVDGVATAMCRANLLFRAVALKPGEHRIVFTFRPLSLGLGAAVSGIGLVLLALASRLMFRPA